MLVVPYLVGLIERGRSLGGLPLYVWPLFAFLMLGYFTFNAASLWLKAAPSRRPPLVKPLVTYAAASGFFGSLTLAAAGPQVLGWVPVYVALLTPALVLASRRRERATLGGGLTTAAASLMALVVTHPSPMALFAWTPSDQQAVVTASLVFAYFFGTVLYVKTNIREKGSRGFYVASVVWHALATGTAIALTGVPTGPLVSGAASGVDSRAGSGPAWGTAAVAGWVGIFALATLRAAAIPRLRRPFKPLHIGLLEIAFCVAILLTTALG